MQDKDKYGEMAHHYDAAYGTINLPDTVFYLDLAKESGGPVLELGCGTGRVLIPTAQAGITIHGVDDSDAMLAILAAKIGALPEAVRNRVDTTRADMRRLDLGKQFPLITIPFRPLQHMYTIDDQIAALNAAKRHLTPNGILVFDVFNPMFEKIATDIGEEIREMEWPLEDGRRIIRFFRRDKADMVEQYFSGVFIFRTYRGDTLVEEQEQPFKMGYYTYPQLRLLFKVAGLAIVEQYGSFDKSAIQHGCSDLIFKLSRSHDSEDPARV